MRLYDDKTENTISTGNKLLIPNIDSTEDIVFKASYIVSANISCKGKITALFDLIVFGDVSAEEIDVKGRFVCMGQCTVSNSIIVQNDIWCEHLQASTITCHDRIIAQSIDADTVFAESNIIIGKTLAIEKKAQTYQTVICGETAYGAGTIVATKILTSEPLDLDEGEEALEKPFQYMPKKNAGGISLFSEESAKYAHDNDYSGYISILCKNSDKKAKQYYNRCLFVLKTIEEVYPDSITDVKDASLLIWLLEISNSLDFNGWKKIAEWTEALINHFKDMAEGKALGLHDPRPAENIEIGYTVLHQIFGRGVVRSSVQNTINGNNTQMIVVTFEQHGDKKFPIPDSLKYFSIISETEVLSGEKMKASIQCNINGYSEWLSSLQIINQYKETIGNNLYNILYELLLAKLGLKPKFVEDRFKEKGWN